MATKEKKAELPKGFTAIDKFNGKFTLNGTQFEFSKVVSLNSPEHGVVEGQVYRYPIAPHQLYFTTVTGQYLTDVNGFAWIKEAEKETEENQS